MAKITVVLVEDHRLVREGIRALLETEGDIEVIAEAQDGRQAVQLVKLLSPEVVVMDVGMPSLNGVEAARQILAAVPGTRVLFLSAYGDGFNFEHAMAAGATGYLVKEGSFEHLSRAIREISRGGMFFSPGLSPEHHDRKKRAENPGGEANADHAPLSSRSVETLQLVAEGKPNKQIAAELGISIKTVEKHRHRLMETLNIHDTAGLTRYALAAGIIEGTIPISMKGEHCDGTAD